MAIRDELVAAALVWQERFGIAPSITTAISEYDAAVTLLGMTEEDYGWSQRHATAVQKGFDFQFQGLRYQVKANRPSGKPGSFVTLCAKARNYDWDRLIWILYDRFYVIQEAWMWEVEAYRNELNLAFRSEPYAERNQRFDSLNEHP